MDKKIIIHIPHASLKLPNIFYQRILIDKEQLEKENIFVSDYLVDKLISNQTKNIIKFNYSRLFCDVERFKDDDLEIMSKVGMGAIYEKDSNGNNFIKYDLKYKNLVLTKHYDKYHDDINQKVDNLLNKYGDVI